jgi:hypothetical protein
MTEARTYTNRRIGHEPRRKVADREFGSGQMLPSETEPAVLGGPTGSSWLHSDQITFTTDGTLATDAVATFPAHRVEDLVEFPRLVGKLVVGATRLSN